MSAVDHRLSLGTAVESPSAAVVVIGVVACFGPATLIVSGSIRRVVSGDRAVFLNVNHWASFWPTAKLTSEMIGADRRGLSVVQLTTLIEEWREGALACEQITPPPPSFRRGISPLDAATELGFWMSGAISDWAGRRRIEIAEGAGRRLGAAAARALTWVRPSPPPWAGEGLLEPIFLDVGHRPDWRERAVTGGELRIRGGVVPL